MKFTKLFLLITVISGVILYACKDKTSDPGPVTTDKCASKSITLTGTITPAIKCEANGKIVARAKGSTGFTFQLNNGTFQSDSTFNNLSAGTYTITTKDADGCSKSASFTLGETGTKGPSYTFVASIIGAKCVNGFCHGTGTQDPKAPKGIFATDCGIIARKELIKLKAHDSNMGNLDAGEKDKILTWYNAGGRFTD